MYRKYKESIKNFTGETSRKYPFEKPRRSEGNRQTLRQILGKRMHGRRLT
jgi:hypothetical protein